MHPVGSNKFLFGQNFRCTLSTNSFPHPEQKFASSYLIVSSRDRSSESWRDPRRSVDVVYQGAAGCRLGSQTCRGPSDGEEGTKPDLHSTNLMYALIMPLFVVSKAGPSHLRCIWVVNVAVVLSEGSCMHPAPVFVFALRALRPRRTECCCNEYGNETEFQDHCSFLLMPWLQMM